MQNGNRQLTVFYVCALSLWAEGSPHIPSGLSGTGGGNVPVKPPSRRIPAPRPGLQETPQRFTAGPGHR